MPVSDKRMRSDSRETRRRILLAASEVFSRKGFWEASNAEISKLAKTNSASINYHFSSKENLYVQAWKSAFDLSIEKHPIDDGVKADASATERLSGRISSLVKRFIDPETYDLDIFQKELANPTGLLDEVISVTLKPIHEDLLQLVEEILGKNCDRKDVVLCFHSILGQCLNVMRHMRKTDEHRFPRVFSSDFPAFSTEEAISHICSFTLAGMRRIKEESVSKKGVSSDVSGIAQ